MQLLKMFLQLRCHQPPHLGVGNENDVKINDVKFRVCISGKLGKVKFKKAVKHKNACCIINNH